MHTSWSTAEDYGVQKADIAILTKKLIPLLHYIIYIILLLLSERITILLKFSDVYAKPTHDILFLFFKPHVWLLNWLILKLWPSGTWHRVLWQTAMPQEPATFSATLMMEVAGSSKIIVPIYQTAAYGRYQILHNIWKPLFKFLILHLCFNILI